MMESSMSEEEHLIVSDTTLRDNVHDNEAALRQIELTYDETLRALGAALDLRDTETAGHSERVTRYSLQIARVMKCSSEQLTQIARGAYLHDIGKIGIPDAVLRKEGKLDADETEIMRTHVRIGYELVSQIAFLAPAAELILAHHESHDGSGYPRGLRGDAIPASARIFAVADALDAITSDRPYRRARPFDAACEEIRGAAGRQFDPRVVEAFLSIPDYAIRGTVLEERRRSARLPLRTVVNCRVRGDEFLSTSWDLSETGISFTSRQRVDVGQEMDLEFALPPATERLRARAKVARRELPDRLAVQFVAISGPDRQSIQQYIAQRIQV
jgi:putative nucleotidyltransferase with HDIG domain